MIQFHDTIHKILTQGCVKADRTGVGTVSYFGITQTYDLTQGFPLLGLKKTNIKPIVEELLFFIAGETNNEALAERGVHIWDPWAAPNGDLGPIYGAQWNNWQAPATKDTRPLWTRLKAAWRGEPTPTTGINQLHYVIDTLKTNPKSRRMLVTAWNPAVLPDEGVSHLQNVANGKQVLPPCHTMFQFDAQPIRWEERLQYLVDQGTFESFETACAGLNFSVQGESEATVDAARHTWIDAYFEDGEPEYKYRLNCLLLQRSCDALIGNPFNVASYSLLTLLIAQCVGMEPGKFVHVTGDTHIYLNHLDAAKELMERESPPLPRIVLNPEVKDLWAFTANDIELENYVSLPAIKLPVAV